MNELASPSRIRLFEICFFWSALFWFLYFQISFLKISFLFFFVSQGFVRLFLLDKNVSFSEALLICAGSGDSEQVSLCSVLLFILCCCIIAH